MTNESHIKSTPTPGSLPAASSHTSPQRSPRDIELGAVFDSVVDGLLINTLEGEVVEANRAVCEMHGYTHEEFIGLDPQKFIHPDDFHLFGQYLKTVLAGKPFRCTARDLRKDGSAFEIDVHGSLITFRGKPHILGVVRDISHQLKVEADLEKTQVLYSDLFEHAPDMIASIDAVFASVVECNETLAETLGYDKSEVLGRSIFDLYDPSSVRAAKAAFRALYKQDRVDGVELLLRTKDGRTIDVSLNGSAVRDAAGNILRTRSIWRDITAHKRAERLVASRAEVLEQLATGTPLSEVLATLVNSVEQVCPGLIGSVLLLDEDGKRLRLGAAPSLPDFYNDAIEGLTIGPEVGSCGAAAFTGERIIVEDVMSHPFWTDFRDLASKANLRACWSEPITGSQGDVLGTFAIYYRLPRGPEEEDLKLIRDSAHLASIAIENRLAQDELELLVNKRTKELATANASLTESNQDLQDFAYVASHDLQEPLRMVTSYCQLLQKRYQDKLDSDANEFIEFAVDGATRMQTLIQDLLKYSRVQSQAQPFTLVDCAELMDEVIRNLRSRIQSTGATVTHQGLPTVMADRSQLLQVFQNLVDNGIKYHDGEPPTVHVSARQDANEWLFAVQDNGIGIESKYREQIFTVFKRLHARDQYEGTGIGLAICKRAIFRHGGRIWCQPRDDGGTTFFFTLPVDQGDPQ